MRGEVKYKEHGGIPTAFVQERGRDYTALYCAMGIIGMVVVAVLGLAFMVSICLLAVCAMVCVLSIGSMRRHDRQ